MTAPCRTAPAAAASELAELICADDDFVRAEFAAIVAAEWGSPPPSRPAPRPPGPDRRRPTRGPVAAAEPCSPGRAGPANTLLERQRSPPRPITNSITADRSRPRRGW
jgi:hypothetical protein